MDINYSTIDDEDSLFDGEGCLSPVEAAERNRMVIAEMRDLRESGQYCADSVQEAYDAHRFQLTDEACDQVEKRIARLRTAEASDSNPLQTV